MFVVKASSPVLRVAALFVLCALMGHAAWAQQQGRSNSETERLLSQKAMMLQVYLASKKVSDALRSGDAKNAEIVKRARAELAEGAAALEKGDLKLAEERLNGGLRQVSTLVLQQGTEAENPAVKKSKFKSRRSQITSFLRALETGSDETSLSPWTGRLAVARDRLKQADDLFGKNKFSEAYNELVSIYEDVVVIVSEARRSQSVVYRLNFLTPADEYNYELSRNKSYEILVDIAIAEKQKSAKALRPYIRQLVGKSQGLRKQAETEAANGDHVAAIKTLENATSHLVRALNSAGIMVTE